MAKVSLIFQKIKDIFPNFHTYITSKGKGYRFKTGLISGIFCFYKYSIHIQLQKKPVTKSFVTGLTIYFIIYK